MMRLMDHKQDQRRKFPFINKLERDLAKMNEQMPSLVQSKQKQRQLFDIYLSGKKMRRKIYSQQLSTTINNQEGKKVENALFTPIIQSDDNNHKLIDQQAQTQGLFLAIQMNKKAKRNIINNHKPQKVAKISIIHESPPQIISVINKTKLTPQRYFQSILRGRQSILNNINNKKPKQHPPLRKKREQSLRYQSISMRRSRNDSLISKNNSKKQSRKFSQSCKNNREERKLSSRLQSSLLKQGRTIDLMVAQNNNLKEEKQTINTTMASPEMCSSFGMKQQECSVIKCQQVPFLQDSSKLTSMIASEKQISVQTLDQTNNSNKFPRRNIQLTTVQERSETQKEVNDTQNADSFSILPNPNFHASQSAITPLIHLQSFRSQQKFTHKTESIQVSEQEIQRQSQFTQSKQYQKVDQIMQFPEITELKISAQNSKNSITNSQQKQNHPIRSNFNEKNLSWITQFFRPKSHFLKQIPHDQCIIKKYRNGVYFGQIQQNRKHGFGVIFYFDGRMFEGKFENDLKVGEGYEQFPDGSKYTGQFQRGTKNGKGTFQWPNGEVYEGQWQNGRKHGSGMWKSAEGQSYIGEWKNGKPQGFGVYISSLGDRYEGEFSNSQKQGLGTERFHNGETYVGEYRKNLQNGKGEYFWTNGSYYKGDFANNLRHGEGYFSDPKKGIQYKGQYKNDKRCGYGELRHQDQVYVGNFQNDYRHGYGELYNGEKLKFKGFWVNDVLLQEENQQENDQQQSPSKRQVIPHHVQEHHNKIEKTKARVNKMQSIINQEGKMLRKLQKSKSPVNNSIQTLQNSRSESGQKRSCGCTRRH